MESITAVAAWLETGEGRIAAALVLFLVLWGIKNVGWVKKKVLTTPRRRQFAVALLATAPVITMLLDSVPAKDAFITGLTAFLSAMGLNSLRSRKNRALSKPKLSDSDLPGPEPEPKSDPEPESEDEARKDEPEGDA